MISLVVHPLLIYVARPFELRFLNSAIRSSACTSSSFSHELSLVGYPFHLIRKYFFCPLPWRFSPRTFSTSYSGVSLISSSGGRVNFGPFSSVSLYGIRRVAWNTLCIFHCQ